MSDDNHQTQDVETQRTEAQTPVAPVSDASSQPKGSTLSDLPPEAPESPVSDVPPIPVESVNSGLYQPESKPVEPPKESQIEVVSASPVQPVSALASQTPQAPQTPSLAQQDQRGFIRSLLVKAQAKIQFNKQKKLEKIIQLAQKKQTITNDDVQKLLRVSDATATRYLVKLVEQGHLACAGNPRDAKYQFVR